LTPDELVRIVNALLALACAIGYGYGRIWWDRARRSAEETMLRLGIVVVLFGVSLGTAEALAHDNRLVLAHFLLTPGFVGIQVGLWHTRPSATRRED